MAAHAILGASSSKRWLVCTPSPRLELTIKTPEPESGHAAEGTVAHDLFEQVLSYHMGWLTDEQYEAEANRIKAICFDKAFDFEDMVIHSNTCATFVRSYLGPGDTLLLEKRVDYSPWVPEGFGTSDVIIYGNDRIHVLDLKYGKGVKVHAEENSQMRLYALGSLHTMNVVCSRVITTVMQPRLNHFDSEEISHSDLMEWTREVVVPQAKKAWDGRGDFMPGAETCRFCKAKAVCKARANKDLNEAIIDFQVMKPKKVDTLTEDEVLRLLEKAEPFVKWIEDAKAHITAKAMAGDVPEGYELRQRSAPRKWKSNEAIVAKLRELSVPDSDIFEVRSVAKIEQRLSKPWFAANLADLTKAETGKPALMRKNGYEGAEDAANDFA